MPPARLVAAALWLTVTMAATATVWAATSIVASDVTDRPASILAHRDVVSELEAGPPAPTSSTTLKPVGSTSTVPSRSRVSVPPGSSPTVTAAPPSQAAPPATTVPPPVASPASPPTTRPSSPSTSVPSQPTATYSTSGGVVRVSCNGLVIQLVSAIPANGYGVRVVAAGPASVDVHFLGSGQDVSVKAVCFGQPIRYDGQVPTRQAPGSF